MAMCCSPCDEVKSRGGGYAIHDCLVDNIFVCSFNHSLKLQTIRTSDFCFQPDHGFVGNICIKTKVAKAEKPSICCLDEYTGFFSEIFLNRFHSVLYYFDIIQHNALPFRSLFF